MQLVLSMVGPVLNRHRVGVRKTTLASLVAPELDDAALGTGVRPDQRPRLLRDRSSSFSAALGVPTTKLMPRERILTAGLGGGVFGNNAAVGCVTHMGG